MSTERSFESDPSGSSRAVPNYPITNQVAVTDAAVMVVARRPGRRVVTVKNSDDDNDMFVGNETVTATTGLRLKPGESIQISSNESLYAICANGVTATASILEE